MVEKTIIKRDGTEVPYDEEKIKVALNKAFASFGYEEAPQSVVTYALFLAGCSDVKTVEDIQDRVQTAIMTDGYYKVAAEYIKYREKHSELRFIEDRLKYMEAYSSSNKNAASSSETDDNSNVSQKNVANLEGEVYKTTNRLIQRRRMKKKLLEMFPEVADQYEKDLNDRIIYVHDEAATPALKPYTYSPYESIEAKYCDLHLLTSLQSLYNEIQCVEVLEDEKNGIWCKYPSNLYVKDRNGWTKVTRLTKKNRHRDLVRVKTAFGEDIIVTDNHPMIIGDDKNSTKQAIDVIGEKQLRLDNSITFDGINVLDLASCVECDEVYSNFITTRESKHTPYFYSKRFIKIDRSLGYVVGFFIGDGNYDNTFGNISFTQKEKETLNKLAEMLFDSFGVVSYSNCNDGSNPDIWHMKVCSRVVENVFRNFFKIKDKAENKCLPYNLLMFNEDFAKGIIEGLIDSDGTIQNDNSTIQIRLSSRECITQLTKLLRYFGYGVGNSYQQTPFGNNTKIHTNYTIWGVVFTKTSNAIPFDWSYKFQKNITNNIDNGLKYSIGWATVTNVQKIENGSFLNKCNYIYDITTETNTFDCNNLWVHNCMAVSLYPFMKEGSGNIDGITPTPPNDIQSFSGQITNLVFLLSSQVKGAVALGEYMLALNYYVVKEFGNEWYNHLDDTYTINTVSKPRTTRDAILKGMKQFIYGINQPAGNRSYNSPFTNISYYDKTYFNALFNNFTYPDGTKPEWKQIDMLQRMFCKLHRELRLIKPLTFPVTTFCAVHNNNDCIDTEFKEWMADEYSKGTSAFTFLSDSPTSLASCCRVLNKLTFSSTTGGLGIMTGSCNVITLNINRIVQNYFRTVDLDYSGASGIIYKDITESDMDEFIEYFKAILERVYKYQIAFKAMLYEQEEKGMFSASNAGYIKLSKLYCTIGVLGYFEAAKYLGFDTDYNEDYIRFLQTIFGTIKEENEKFSIHGKRSFIFNTEAVPGESLGVKFYNWDKNDGYIVPKDQNLYNCYFFNPWDNTDVLTKMKLHGKEVAPYLGGGQACHVNLSSHLSKEQYIKLIDNGIKFGTNYFTYNIPMSECKDCGHVVNAPIKECPHCKSTNIKYWTRIIGYLTSVDNWSIERQKEFHKRMFGEQTI